MKIFDRCEHSIEENSLNSYRIFFLLASFYFFLFEITDFTIFNSITIREFGEIDLGDHIFITIPWLFFSASFLGSFFTKRKFFPPVIANLLPFWVILIAFLATLTSALLCTYALDRLPHIQDDIVQVFQAKIFASGRLWAPAPKYFQFFDMEFMICDGQRWFGKYFWGQSLLMVTGIWLNLTWLVNPVIGGICIILIYLLVKTFYGKPTALVSSLLTLISPFFLYMNSSFLSHPSEALFLLLFLIFLFRIQGNQKISLFLSGSAWALAWNTRPLVALAFLFPSFFFWLKILGYFQPPIFEQLNFKIKVLCKNLIWFAIPAVAGYILFLLYNKALTGEYFKTPFIMYDPADRLGFGANVGLPYWREMVVWWTGHTPLRGLFNLVSNLFVLNEDLLGWCSFSLFPIFFTFFLEKKDKKVINPPSEDKYLLSKPELSAYQATWLLCWIIFAVAFAYFFYIADGICFGARYYYEAGLILIILAARGLILLYQRLNKDSQNIFLKSTFTLFLIFLTVWSIKYHFPRRYWQIKNVYILASPRLMQTVNQAGIKEALIFITGTYYKATPSLDLYATGFNYNSPDLDTPIIFARDFGSEYNPTLAKEYPNIPCYIYSEDFYRRPSLKPVKYE